MINLNACLTMTDKQLESAIILLFSDHKGLIYSKGNYIVIHEDLSLLTLVAHIDTVKHSNKVELVYEGQNITNKHGILGADDRAGIYAILKLYQSSKIKPSLIFTQGEEIGGIGVKALIKNEPTFIGHLKSQRMLIELDRKGCNEYVNYNTLSDEVHQYMYSNGYVEENGSYSDVCSLELATGTPSVNLSIGYFKQHTKKEYLNMATLNFCIAQVENLILNPIDDRYGNDPGYGDYITLIEGIPDVCPNCGSFFEDCYCGTIYSEYMQYMTITELKEIYMYHKNSELGCTLDTLLY